MLKHKCIADLSQRPLACCLEGQLRQIEGHVEEDAMLLAVGVSETAVVERVAAPELLLAISVLLSVADGARALEALPDILQQVVVLHFILGAKDQLENRPGMGEAARVVAGAEDAKVVLQTL